MRQPLRGLRQSRLHFFFGFACLLLVYVFSDFDTVRAASSMKAAAVKSGLASAEASGMRTGISGSDAENASADEPGTALTIYNQNFFVAREHVPLDLQPGVNEAHYTGVAAHLEPNSVILRDPKGRALQILEQNYRNDPVTQELLLSFYEGKMIDFAVGRNADGSDVKLRGKVIRSGFMHANYISGYPQQASTQPIIEVDGVLRFGLPGQPIFQQISRH